MPEISNLYYLSHVLEKLVMASYPGSMRNSEWNILETLLPSQPDTLRGRPQEHSRRNIIDWILYILGTGAAWRMMPHDLPH